MRETRGKNDDDEQRRTSIPTHDPATKNIDALLLPSLLMMVLTQKINAVFVFFCVVVDFEHKRVCCRCSVVDFLIFVPAAFHGHTQVTHEAKKTFRIFEVRWSKNGEKNGGRER